MDTVKLGGQPFTIYVQGGNRVTQGPLSK
ncbi:hypothetical protein M1D61_09670 [Paenibacillus sp. Z6-24]